METVKEYILDMLTEQSVSVITKEFIEIDGQKIQLGQNSRCAYSNNTYERNLLKDAVPEQQYNAVITVWGPEPVAEAPVE